MRIVLDENLPAHVRSEIKAFHGSEDILDVDHEYKGILDFELVDMMKDDDLLITGDLELHKNMIQIGNNCIYYDVQADNLVEVQVKTAYYLKGLTSDDIERCSEVNMDPNPNTQLRDRFEELKKENSELKVKVNILEGKLKSILNTANSALDT